MLKETTTRQFLVFQCLSQFAGYLWASLSFTREYVTTILRPKLTADVYEISSASPISALISTKSPMTSFAVVHLNGTIDWMIAQRQALLAWTGHTLSITPTTNRRLVCFSLAITRHELTVEEPGALGKLSSHGQGSACLSG